MEAQGGLQRSLLLAFLLLVATSWSELRSQTTQPLRADEEAGKALDFMDRNMPEAAIAAWDKALTFMPGYVPYMYEKTVCLVMAKRYPDALALLEPVHRDTSLGERGYQLLGNIHDLLQDTTSSRKAYREGLERFPRSGRLHFEMGQQYYVAFDRNKAHEWWLNGTRVEPTYAKNYYWLARSYSETKDKIWGAFYAEAFLNLERNTIRTKEMSELVFAIWNASMRLGDTIDPINFCSDELLEEPSPFGPSKMSFPVAFEFTMGLAGQVLTPKDSVVTRLTISQLVDLRYRFTRAWSSAGHDTTYRNDILRYNIFLQKEGRLKEYLWWLYSYGDKVEMNRYFRKNEERYDTFLVWFSEHGLDMSQPLCVGLGCR
jgi:tetratricopeptide (TPR) repeat protein